MDTNILFTKSNKPGSWVIRGVTGEDISHCAVQVGSIVLHSTGFGVRLEHNSQFFLKNKLVYSVPVDFTLTQFCAAVQKYVGKKYDYLGFLMLGLRLLAPKLVKPRDIREISGSYICTELVSVIFLGEEKLLTPYQLYLKLKGTN